jgi:ribosome-associated protein
MAKSKKKTKVTRKKPAKRKAPVKKKIVKRARKPAAKKAAAKKFAAKKIASKKAVKKPAAKKALPPIRIIGGLPGQLYEAAMKVLHDRQAEEVVAIDLAGRSSMADYLIIASGRASRQIAAIADYLREAFDKLGARNIRVEGLPQANWVLVDAGDIVVHLFRPEVRRYYRLEDIWTR